MKSTHRLVICCVALLNASPLAAEPAPTGPAAEKRFAADQDPARLQGDALRL